MSLLELAKQGLARQYKHTRLNAYVNSTSPEAVLAAATAAQDRRDNGRYNQTHTQIDSIAGLTTPFILSQDDRSLQLTAA